MKVLFLDIDGVLNSHTKLANGYCGIEPKQAEMLNCLLDDIPDLKLVISSAWRYLVLNQSMSVVGFENLLLTHGIKCLDRVIDVLPEDYPLSEYPNGGREQLILEHIEVCTADRSKNYPFYVTKWAVVDDLPLEIDNFVRTNGEMGMSLIDLFKLSRILKS